MAAHPPARGRRAGAAETVWRLGISGAGGDHHHADVAPGWDDPRDAGYDPATQLLLIDPPVMPDIPETSDQGGRRGRAQLLKNDLLFEFIFDNDGGVSRAVALSAIISTVCRGAFPVMPMHIIDAPTAGSGKSYLLSTVSRIATGHPMPVLGAGKSEEELEKRLARLSFTVRR